MRLLFLGTAASEGYPNAFCACENCEEARQLGGSSLRKRSSVLINNELLIDLGPDLMAAAQQHGVSLANIRYCLQTHEHADHLDASHFGSRSQYCGVYGTPMLHYYASRGALDKAAHHFGRTLPAEGFLTPELDEKLNLQTYPLEPFQAFAVGPYEVLSVAATHAPELTALLYVISHAGRTLFYGTDTSDLSAETWQALVDYRRPLHAVIMDHTFGFQGRSSGHMNSAQFVEQIAHMRAHGLLAEGARIYATHIAHHSNPVHPKLAEVAARCGYEVAYDGATIEV